MKDYKDIWDNLSVSFNDAAFFVCCLDDEDQIRSNGALTSAFLRQVLQISPDDRVLEIGCGIGRIGRELAPHCGEWHGADISGNMIAHAKERTAGVPNVFLHELPESNLSIFSDNYFDCVYSTIVFMHLDKLEMFSYMEEAFRALAPGGRAYFDTYNILAPQAWQEFRGILDKFPYGTRPGHLSQFSTPQEMRKFMEEAGFEQVHVDGDNNPQLVLALGRKPSGEASTQARASSALRPNVQPNEPTSEGISRDLPVVGLHPSAYEWLMESERLNKVVLTKTAHLTTLEDELERLQASIAAKNSYIQRVDVAVSAKDRHIQRLERLAHKHEKLLSSLPVRLALRLRGRPSRKR